MSQKLSIEKIVDEVIQVCKQHAEDGCFDHEGAEVNALRILKAMESEASIESKEEKNIEKLLESVSFNITSESGDKLIVVELDDVKRKLLDNLRPQGKSCPTCLSSDVIMFTADLDLCQKCGQQF